MIRNKILKKITAVVLTAVMTGAVFTGCSDKTKSSGGMFKTMQAAAEVEKADIKTVIELKGGGETGTVTLEGRKDGNNRAFDVEINFNGESFGIEDAIIITEDALYLNYKNAKEAVCEASGVTGAGDEFDKLLGVSGDWLSLEMKGAFDTEGIYDSETAKQLDETFRKFIDKDISANIYTIAFTENDGLKKFFDTAADYIDDNKEEWARKFVKRAEKYETQVVDIAGQFIDALAEKLNENGEVVSDDDIAEAKSEIESGVNTGLDKDELSEQIGDFADELRDYSSDEDINIEFSVSKDKDSYTQYTGLTVGSGSDKTVLKMTTTITPDKKAEVTVPESDDDMIDIVANAVAYYLQVNRNPGVPGYEDDDIIVIETETDEGTEAETEKETEDGETETTMYDSSSDNSYYGELVAKTRKALADYVGADSDSLEVSENDSEYSGKTAEITSYDVPFGWMTVEVNVIDGDQEFEYDDDFLDLYKEDEGYKEYDFQYKDGYSVRAFAYKLSSSDAYPCVMVSVRDTSKTSALCITASACSAEGEYDKLADDTIAYIEEFIKTLDY